MAEEPKERKAFEAWAASVGYHTERDMFQREKYQSTITWELWSVWQARAALSAPSHGEQVRPMVPDGWSVERGCSPSGYVLHSPGGSMIRVCDSGMGGIETAFAMFLKAMLAASPSAGSQEQGE